MKLKLTQTSPSGEVLSLHNEVNLEDLKSHIMFIGENKFTIEKEKEKIKVQYYCIVCSDGLTFEVFSDSKKETLEVNRNFHLGNWKFVSEIFEQEVEIEK